jgi:DNA-binding transcriptional LysR family regulator
MQRLRRSQPNGRRANDASLLEDHFTDLVDAKNDVGFRAGTTPERNVIARRLRELRLTICASPDYIAEHGKPTTLAQLLRHRCTGFRHPNTGRLVPWELEVDGSLVFQSVPAVASFNEVSAEIEAVRAGIGIGQLLAYMVEADIEAGTLIPLLPKLATARLSLFMYYPHREQLPLRVRRFIDFVVDASSGRQ